MSFVGGFGLVVNKQESVVHLLDEGDYPKGGTK